MHTVYVFCPGYLLSVMRPVLKTNDNSRLTILVKIYYNIDILPAPCLKHRQDPNRGLYHSGYNASTIPYAFNPVYGCGLINKAPLVCDISTLALVLKLRNNNWSPYFGHYS